MRRTCKFPFDCTGPSRGVCKRCQPESAARQNAWLKTMNNDPEFRAKMTAGWKKTHAAKIALRPADFTDAHVEIYRLALAKGCPRQEAIRIARDHFAARSAAQ